LIPGNGDKAGDLSSVPTARKGVCLILPLLIEKVLIDSHLWEQIDLRGIDAPSDIRKIPMLHSGGR
jgi:hypothetical protein